jgi:hypothetical protein
MGASYIKAEIEEEKARKKYLDSLPKLPVGNQLEKTLPKTLRLLSKEDYYLKDLQPCSKELKNIVEFLVLKDFKGVYVTRDKEERDKIFKALSHLSKEACFKMMKEYHFAIHRILKMNLFWIRNIEEWIPKKYKTYQQLKSLIEHLFCKFKVPDFMFQPWFENTENFQHIEWFLQITEGQSVKNLYKFPIPITRRLAHEFISTPFPGYSVEDAVRRSQILSLGGSERLANAILMSRLRNNFSNNSFWETVFLFFINTPMLNYDEVGTVLDYINEMKFVRRYTIVNGIRVYEPEMAGFSMKGRNMASLIQATHAWHRQLGKESKLDLTATWPQCNIRPFRLTEGSIEKGLRVYEIFEITNAKDLHMEGKTMSHCVFSYLRSCISGTCNIFTFRLNDERCATIEIRNLAIVQVRGKRNSKVSEKEKMLISNWAFKENLTITSYAFGGW